MIGYLVLAVRSLTEPELTAHNSTRILTGVQHTSFEAALCFTTPGNL